MRPRLGAALAAWLCCLCACNLPSARQSHERDPFARAEAARARGQLTEALCAFDQVTPDDPRYASARLQAAALEQRLRLHHELLLQGLKLRGEWRSDEAITAFGEALAAWPEDERTAHLLAATQLRRVAVAAPVARDEASEQAAEAQASDGAADATDVRSGPVFAAPGDESAVASPRGIDTVGAQLARLEARLQRGQLDSVLAEMFTLHRRWPNDVRVCARLARLLMQRGLVHYGRGAVAPALEDWRRARKLDPQLQGLAQLIDSASREVVEPPR